MFWSQADAIAIASAWFKFISQACSKMYSKTTLKCHFGIPRKRVKNSYEALRTILVYDPKIVNANLLAPHNLI